MSAWIHSICDDCWEDRCKERQEVGRVPVRLKKRERERCCFCGNQHESGILVRESQAVLACTHGDDE